MLTFARNKVVSVALKDPDTLSIHGVLDDDIYGLQVDLLIGLKDFEVLAVSGKWNRWTTPECPRAIPFLQEIKGDHIDETIGDRINKVLGRKGCRHFANILIECCNAATETAKVVLWEKAKVARPDLSLKTFLEEEARGESDSSRPAGSTGKEESDSPPPPPRVETVHRESDHSAASRPERGERPEGFVIDLHTHSFPASSCSSTSVDELIEEAKRIGLNAICLTDHNHVWTPGQVEALRQKHGFPLLRGNEITTNQGDMLVFGLEKDIKGIITLEDLRKEVLAAGAFMIAAHPFRGFLTFSTVQLGLTPETAAQRPLFRLVDGMEVLNGKVTEKENAFSSSVAETLRLPATGGSDAHQACEVGKYATRFFAEVHTEAELVRALKSGEYVPVAFRSETVGNTAKP
ncbi:MAG: PHP domain-containing protein [Syntrophobacteraceae bacterium]|nr:PHP domain-containing protein [Syntrophobacteraceae bacterium]